MKFSMCVCLCIRIYVCLYVYKRRTFNIYDEI